MAEKKNLKVVEMRAIQKNTAEKRTMTSEELEWEDQVTLGLSRVKSILETVHLISENNDLPEPFGSALDHLSLDALERIRTILGQVEGRQQIIDMRAIRLRA